MLRLPHRILSTGGRIEVALDATPEEIAEYSESLREHAKSTMTIFASRPPVIVADNIVTYYENHPKDEWDLTKDFPNVAPIFPVFFLTARQPERLIKQCDSILEEGWLWLTTDLRINDSPQFRAIMTGGVCHDSFRKALDECRWGMVGQKWLADKKTGHAVFTNSFLFLIIREDGVPLSWRYSIPEHRRSYDVNGSTVINGLHTTLLTLGFLNCKNVQQVDATETEGPPKKWLRRMKQPELKYHTLAIDPGASRKKRATTGAVDGPKKSLHICRGHFAKYTEDGPGLFGRGQYGTFWVPAHTRGSAEHGTVISEYNVKAPGQAA